MLVNKLQCIMANLTTPGKVGDTLNLCTYNTWFRTEKNI